MGARFDFAFAAYRIAESMSARRRNGCTMRNGGPSGLATVRNLVRTRVGHALGRGIGLSTSADGEVGGAGE